MGLLSHEEKQLLFDHSMGLASEQQDDEAERLIASNPDAADFYYKQLEALLSPLESLECEPCPDSLAEQTIRMLTERAHPHAGPSAPKTPDVPPVADTPDVVQQDIGSASVRLRDWRSPVQIAAIEAIKNSAKVKEQVTELYRKRRDVLIEGLNEAGWKIPSPKAAFYVWAPVFGEYDSTTLAKAMLDEADIVVTPGNGFGEFGEGYVRMALTVDVDKLEEAVKRIKEAFFS